MGTARSKTICRRRFYSRPVIDRGLAIRKESDQKAERRVTADYTDNADLQARRVPPQKAEVIVTEIRLSPAWMALTTYAPASSSRLFPGYGLRTLLARLE